MASASASGSAWALCCLALAACGSGSPSSTSSTAGGTASNRATEQVKFADCMRQHGVPISDPANGAAAALSSGVPPRTLQAAIAACRQYAVGALGQFTPQQRAGFAQAFLKYAICLRAHGIDIPDPGESGGAGFGQKLLAAESLPNFRAANAKCRRTLPAQFRGAGAGG